jgi:hypothetical protein
MNNWILYEDIINILKIYELIEEKKYYVKIIWVVYPKSKGK